MNRVPVNFLGKGHPVRLPVGLSVGLRSLIGCRRMRRPYGAGGGRQIRREGLEPVERLTSCKGRPHAKRGLGYGLGLISRAPGPMQK